MTLIDIAQQRGASAPDWRKSLAARIAAISVYALVILSACATQGLTRSVTAAAARAAVCSSVCVKQSAAKAPMTCLAAIEARFAR